MTLNQVDAINVIEDLIDRSKGIIGKFKECSSQYSLVRNRIKALELAKYLLNDCTNDISEADYRLMEKVLISTKSKCEKVVLKLKPNSHQYFHTSKIIEVMKMVLGKLDEVKSPIMLKKPSLDYANQIMEYREAFLERKEILHGCSNLDKYTSVEAWLNHLEVMENSETTPAGYVSASTYLAIRKSDQKLVGMISFRHSIAHPLLSLYGGHIGYSIHPNERRKGYAKAMLKEMLKICKEKGLDKVLITCNKENIASKKTILANSGIFEKEIDVDGFIYERYWIHL